MYPIIFPARYKYAKSKEFEAVQQILHYNEKGASNGPFIQYFENGILATIDFYVNGNKCGVTEGYYIDGKLRYKGEYNEKGKIEGEFKKFNEKGDLIEVMLFSNGELKK
jgi:antitoxin component YwqK of YwqJK toxin-antitoxin module